MKTEFPLPDDGSELNRLLAPGLAPVDIPPDRRAGLRAQLLARVAASAAAHAGLLTVRAGDGRWQAVKSGVRAKSLWQGPEGNSVLIELAPGAALPVHRHQWLEEGIVLEGDLQLGNLALRTGDYQASPPDSRHDRITSRGGALAYLRGTSLGHAGRVLKEIVGGWLPRAGDPPLTVFGRAEGWAPLSSGVECRVLRRDGLRCSRFLRFAPGASLPGHGHVQDEENMLIEGEVFFGDVLVRAGEFHLAPAGSRHGPITTDTGALLFVRG